MNHFQHSFCPNVAGFASQCHVLLFTDLLAKGTQKAGHNQLVLITRPVVLLLIMCFICIQSQLHPIRLRSSQALNASHIQTSQLNS